MIGESLTKEETVAVRDEAQRSGESLAIAAMAEKTAGRDAERELEAEAG